MTHILTFIYFFCGVSSTGTSFVSLPGECFSTFATFISYVFTNKVQNNRRKNIAKHRDKQSDLKNSNAPTRKLSTVFLESKVDVNNMEK